MTSLAAAANADLGAHGHGHNHNHAHGNGLSLPRSGRQESGAITGGIDFTGCETDPETGFCCIEKDETVTSLQKDPILECTHKNVEKCHYTYVTQFIAAQEEVCDENFEKACQITFKQQAFNETVQKCYRPLQKVCNGEGPEECRTVYESSCTTKYVEKQPGKFVGDTSCEKLPVEICGAGCSTEEGEEECHEKVVVSLVDVPEEVCDLNPQKTCRLQTKLVPKLSPKAECTIIPQETCNLKFSQPQAVEQVLKTKWCQDPTPPQPDNSYDDSEAPPPIQQDTDKKPQPNIPPPPPPPAPVQTTPPPVITQPTLPSYQKPTQPPALYSADSIGRGGRFNPLFNDIPLPDFVDQVPAPNNFATFRQNVNDNFQRNQQPAFGRFNRSIMKRKD